MKLQNRNGERSIQLESRESKVITTRSHLLFAERQWSVHRGDHFIFEHSPDASSGNDSCVGEPNARSSGLGISRIMSYIRPCGSVGAAWTARKEAKSGGKNKTALPKEEVKGDSIGDAMFTVKILGKIQILRERRSAYGRAILSTRQRTRRQSLLEWCRASPRRTCLWKPKKRRNPLLQRCC